MPTAAESEITKDLLLERTLRLLSWLKGSDFASFDSYDYWSSRAGLWSKRTFSKSPLVGALPVSAVFLLDSCLPRTRVLFARKGRSAEAIPRIALGCFRLYEITREPAYLETARSLLEWLLQTAVKTAHGIGWGLHFDWQARGFVPAGTPCVTLTAYSTEAFLEGFRLTGEAKYLETAMRTADFVLRDLRRRENGAATAVSYTPLDETYVVNANSYAAKILCDTAAAASDPEKEDLSRRIVRYVLSQQNPDGSWYYSDKDDVPPKRNFIDSFHTGFVLENLHSVWKRHGDEPEREALTRGYAYFKSTFIRPDYSVGYYSYYPYRTGVRVDIRCCAEAVQCLAILSDSFPDALGLSRRVADWTVRNMGDAEGFFYFRLYRTHKNKGAYIRWGQAPMFSAMTNLLSRLGPPERADG